MSPPWSGGGSDGNLWRNAEWLPSLTPLQKTYWAASGLEVKHAARNQGCLVRCRSLSSEQCLFNARHSHIKSSVYINIIKPYYFITKANLQPYKANILNVTFYKLESISLYKLKNIVEFILVLIVVVVLLLLIVVILNTIVLSQ